MALKRGFVGSPSIVGIRHPVISDWRSSVPRHRRRRRGRPAISACRYPVPTTSPRRAELAIPGGGGPSPSASRTAIPRPRPSPPPPVGSSRRVSPSPGRDDGPDRARSRPGRISPRRRPPAGRWRSGTARRHTIVPSSLLLLVPLLPLSPLLLSAASKLPPTARSCAAATAADAPKRRAAVLPTCSDPASPLLQRTL